MTKQRDERKKETRDALVRAAAAELAEKGIEAASLNAICDRAGYTRGAFYVHFKDRDELVAAVVERVLGELQATFFADGEADLGTIIGRFIGAVLGGVPAAVGTTHWQFHHTLAACAGSRRIRKEYVGVQARARDQLAAAAAKGQRNKTIRDDVSPKTLAEILLVLTLGVSAATELGLDLDFAAGGAALGTLLAAPTKRRK